MDHFLGVPQPPIDSVVDPTVQLWVTVVMALVSTVGLVYALLDWRRSGRPIVLMLFLAGGFCMLVEPIVDVVGACWFPAIGQWTVFAAFGRPLPLWLCLVYFVYFGIGIAVSWKFLERGLTRFGLWMLFLSAVLGDFVLEANLLHLDAYFYYGHQPLVLLEFPLWWGAVNGLITVAAAAVVYQLAPLLTGWRVLLIIPTTVAVSGFANFSAGWPSWTVINTELSPVLTQLGGVTTFVLAAWFVYAIALIVTTDAPLRLRIQAGSGPPSVAVGGAAYGQNRAAI